ncbi:MAG: DUF362 domain-containing protein [Proteobacteria bacterium]|nr:DUF362 domain-containing protein [Pseudomonadota bacterium]MBU1687293.1 DUF362 domain-containing protein [Pseudomonadota bacterium]
MNRREFLQQISLWSAGMTLSVPRFVIAETRAAETKPLLSLATGKDYEALVSRVLKPLGGIAAFVKPSDKVVIKPNIGWDRNPGQAANTHPLIVKAMVEQILETGASEVKIFDRTCNEERRCYVNSGIKEVMDRFKDKRVKFFHPDDRKFIPVDIERGKAVTKLEIYQDALEADCYINLPIAKHHSLSRLTMGLKNSMGVLGGRRGGMHHDLGQKLADLATVIRPKLTIIDATRILLANGPQGGDLKDVKILDTLLASTDPVAADAYTTTLFGLKPEDIESTVAAYAFGLGEIDLQKIKVIKA